MNLKKKYATETERPRDSEIERRRDRGTERQRDRGRERRFFSPSLRLYISPSLRPSVPLSLCLSVMAMALNFANGCAEAPGKSSDVYMASRPATLAADEPEPPRVYLDTSYTAPKGRSIEVKAGGDFQAALNQAKPGDAITLEAGATFTGNFTLPNKSGSGQSEWIVVRSSAADSSLPPPALITTASSASKSATKQAPGSTPSSTSAAARPRSLRSLTI